MVYSCHQSSRVVVMSSASSASGRWNPSEANFLFHRRFRSFSSSSSPLQLWNQRSKLHDDKAVENWYLFFRFQTFFPALNSVLEACVTCKFDCCTSYFTMSAIKSRRRRPSVRTISREICLSCVCNSNGSVVIFRFQMVHTSSEKYRTFCRLFGPITWHR